MDNMPGNKLNRPDQNGCHSFTCCSKTFLRDGKHWVKLRKCISWLQKLRSSSIFFTWGWLLLMNTSLNHPSSVVFVFFTLPFSMGEKKKPFSIHLNDYILSHRCAFLKRIFSAAKRTSLAHELKMQRHPLKGDFFILIFFLELCPLLRLSECLCFLASVGVLLFTIWTQRY